MATATLISVDDFIRQYVEKGGTKPSMEYIDGELRQKTMGNAYHGYVQWRLCALISGKHPELFLASELHVRIREGEFLVPDVAAMRRGEFEGPYPTKPVYLCVEILSQGDRFSDVCAKCEEYHRWGVEACWIIDPISRLAWTYSPGQPPREVAAGEALEAKAIRIDLADIFAGMPQ